MVGTELLIIDPQVDFCDPERGALYVKGAESDIDRLSRFITGSVNRLGRIHVTLDSHNTLHIAHPVYWRDAAGDHPAPFTTITAADVDSGRWRAADPGRRDHAAEYVHRLERDGRYQLTIWPYHCLIGTPGHNIMPPLTDALATWERQRLRAVDYIVKGSNPDTEHYSAVRAEMPLPDDVNTQTNLHLHDLMLRAETIIVAGEAGSHCVANTVRDLVALGGDPRMAAAKIVLLSDATCPVSGFEPLQESFISEMSALGMRTATTETLAGEDGSGP